MTCDQNHPEMHGRSEIRCMVIGAAAGASVLPCNDEIRPEASQIPNMVFGKAAGAPAGASVLPRNNQIRQEASWNSIVLFRTCVAW